MSATFTFSMRRLRRALVLSLISILVLSGHAAEVTARASVTQSIISPGERVQFQITVTGAQRSANPPDVKAEGLAIEYLGPTESMVARFSNGSFSRERTVTFNYHVAGEKTGTFTIPAVAVNVDGQSYRTEPVALTIKPASGTGGKGSGGAQEMAFAEIVVPKTTVYVGETVPLELRLYVDARVRWKLDVMPEINGDGFTKQKIPEPRSQQVEKNGRMWDLAVFKTAITPSRAGNLTIGPVETPFNARVPRPKPANRGPRSLLDMFDDDIFGDPMFSSLQQFKPKAKAVEFTVKPLPAEGRPRLFSGAIGQFQLASEASPVQVKVGDPVTVKLRISGRGNFDRLTVPPLKDASGWRTYPAANAFKADDDISYSGTKTFEMAVVPETKKTTMPVFEFSYFDPLVEKYVTLTSAATPLDVTANLAAASTPAPRESSAGNKAGDDAPAPAPRPSDILGQRYDADVAQGHRPLYERREFWLAQGGLGLALFAFLGLRLRRAPDASARALADLRREKARAWSRLETAGLGRVEFYETAARIAQIDTALITGQNAASIDAATVKSTASVSEDSKAVIDEIFGARAELLYAGAGSPTGQVSAAEKERIAGVLRELEKGHAKH